MKRWFNEPLRIDFELWPVQATITNEYIRYSTHEADTPLSSIPD